MLFSRLELERHNTDFVTRVLTAEQSEVLGRASVTEVYSWLQTHFPKFTHLRAMMVNHAIEEIAKTNGTTAGLIREVMGDQGILGPRG